MLGLPRSSLLLLRKGEVEMMGTRLTEEVDPIGEPTGK